MPLEVELTTDEASDTLNCARGVRATRKRARGKLRIRLPPRRDRKLALGARTKVGADLAEAVVVPVFNDPALRLRHQPEILPRRSDRRPVRPNQVAVKGNPVTVRRHLWSRPGHWPRGADLLVRCTLCSSFATDTAVRQWFRKRGIVSPPDEPDMATSAAAVPGPVRHGSTVRLTQRKCKGMPHAGACVQARTSLEPSESAGATQGVPNTALRPYSCSGSTAARSPR